MSHIRFERITFWNHQTGIKRATIAPMARTYQEVPICEYEVSHQLCLVAKHFSFWRKLPESAGSDGSLHEVPKVHILGSDPDLTAGINAVSLTAIKL